MMSTLYTFTEHTILHSGSHVSNSHVSSSHVSSNYVPNSYVPNSHAPNSHALNSHLDVLLHIPHWEIQSGQHWAVVGGRDDQRTAIMQLIHNNAVHTPTNKSTIPLAEISLHEQQRRIDEELIKAKAGIADELFAGTQVSDIIADVCTTLPPKASIIAKIAAEKLITTFDFDYCQSKHFRELSSGETRSLLIIIALAQQPELLLMQDPYEGLDNQTRPIVQKLFSEIMVSHKHTHHKKTANHLVQINNSIFVSSRIEQLPSLITHVAYIESNQLHTQKITNDNTLSECLTKIKHIIKPDIEITLPALPSDHPFHKSQALDASKPLVNMSNVSIQYADLDKPIFEKLDWQIKPLQHWRVTGKNGSGKTTLLKLITGDHPQVYNNDISVCGFHRGSGESIWDVKRYIGYMSGETLWNYRGSGQLAGKALSVVISGLYDSVGLYTAPNAADKAAAYDWLILFNLQPVANKRFQNLSLAEQRLLLIARAMIKRPALLILDEPLQGLDSEDRLRILAIIEKLIAAKATTLLYVSHHEDEQVEGVDNTLTL